MGLTLQGAVWDGDRAEPGQVVVGDDGTIESIERDVDPLAAGPVVSGAWVGPALVDAHVHLAFGGPEEVLAGGVGAVRDLGAPVAQALGWRERSVPVTAVAGEVVTALGGYPTTTWGSTGFGRPVAGPRSAAEAVRALADAGVDVVKLALEPAGRLPVLDLPTCRAAVTAAHAAGLSVTCHALSAAMVARAVDAGVDELAHTPTEPLPAGLVERLAKQRLPVVSTLQALVDAGAGEDVLANAKALVRAGVRLVYGTDLGNAGTRPGASAAELRRLAAAGLGNDGALRAATTSASQVAGLAGRVETDVRVGARTVLVVLATDPVVDPSAWDEPVAVVAGGRVVGGTAAGVGS